MAQGESASIDAELRDFEVSGLNVQAATFDPDGRKWLNSR